MPQLTAWPALTSHAGFRYQHARGAWPRRLRFFIGPRQPGRFDQVGTMKIRNSLKALKTRHRENRVVRRKGRIYVINKSNPRFKARQG